MKKLIAMAAIAALAAGCSVTKVNYERKENGEVSYRIYRNSHWLKMDAEGLSGGMSEDGKFEIALEGMKASPSEEFNRTMQTYTSAFIQLAQIAAAAYNPSASSAIQSAAAKQSASTTPSVNVQVSQPSQASQSATDCKDGSCTDNAACPDGSCNPPPVTQPAAESATK